MAIALVIGGGAPNLTLMAGALAAFDERGVEFDVLSTSGAGMLVGLLYAAPKGMTRQEALRNTVNLGVSDLIYSLFPVNYKVFYRPGPLGQIYTQLQLQTLPRPDLKSTPDQRLLLDWAALVWSAFCPSDLTPFSRGLCQPAPWIEQAVDFDRLRNEFPGEFFLNAWSLTEPDPKRKMKLFPKEMITADHFRAGLAFPFIYAPFRLDGETFIEGSALEVLNFAGLLEPEHTRATLVQRDAGTPRQEQRKEELVQRLKDVDPIVIFDVLGREQLIHEPRSLYDAWVQSIIVPLVSIAKKDAQVFEYKHNPRHQRTLLRLPFDIPQDRWPHVLDWSYSNLKALFEIGYRSGAEFYARERDKLTP